MFFILISIVYSIEIRLTNLQQVYYSVPIEINNSTFNLILDTGSDTLWIFGKETDRKKYYECQDCEAISQKSLQYGLGKIDGIEYNQTIKISNFSINISVVEAKQIEYLYSLVGDGLIGLSSKYQNQDSDIIDRLYMNNMIDSKQFGLLLNDQICQQNSLLILGLPHIKYFINELQYINITSSDLWNIYGSTIEIVGKNKKEMLENNKQNILFDSGTSKIIMSKYKFNKLHNILNDEYNLDCEVILHNQFNELICKYSEQEYPSFIININNNLSLTLLPQDYVAFCGYNYFIQYRCHLSFQYLDNQDELILGVIVLQKYYTHYNMKERQIGIAQSITYQRDKLKLSQLGNEYNFSMLYYSILTVTCILLSIWVIIKILLKQTIPLYLSVLEKSSSRSQEQEMEAMTLKTQTSNQPPLST